MKRTLFCLLLFTCPLFCSREPRPRQQGTIVRMRMTDCIEPQHAFMANMSGVSGVDSGLQCPEYVLVTDEIVYIISGKGSDEYLPLAEITRFRMRKNEMLIRVDDAPKESRFHIRAMIMRSDWERAQKLEEAAMNAMISQHIDPATMRNQH
jgi:hypothetical protein